MKLSELSSDNFNHENIENSFHVDFDQDGQPIRMVKMSNVVEHIIEIAKKEGLQIENKGDRIIIHPYSS